MNAPVSDAVKAQQWEDRRILDLKFPMARDSIPFSEGLFALAKRAALWELMQLTAALATENGASHFRITEYYDADEQKNMWALSLLFPGNSVAVGRQKGEREEPDDVIFALDTWAVELNDEVMAAMPDRFKIKALKEDIAVDQLAELQDLIFGEAQVAIWRAEATPDLENKTADHGSKARPGRRPRA